eukprot:6489363-Amphidinium_carterae.1
MPLPLVAPYQELSPTDTTSDIEEADAHPGHDLPDTPSDNEPVAHLALTQGRSSGTQSRRHL